MSHPVPFMKASNVLASTAKKLPQDKPDLEEAIDYLLLGRGDCVAMSYRLEHPGLDFLPLASGEIGRASCRERVDGTV